MVTIRTTMFNIQQFYVLPTVYLCVLCGSENKQRLFPYTILRDWFFNRDGVFTAKYGLNLRVMYINPSNPSGHYKYYHQFNIQQFYVLPTQCIHVFCVDLRTNSDYFPIQH